ncbi:IclR family transcriptional regulator [Streptomyces sp. NPDC026206]|uniref:IclR family transcriptional regulator n=1 Tax=Streptomyces sp. NPDC026206 TaxID=3157089 RepID=UPI0033F6103F
MSTAASLRPRYESGVGVLDKASLLLGVLEDGPASSARIVAASGLSRPTVYRLAMALERLRLVTRDSRGRYMLGPRLGEMAVEVRGDRMVESAGPVLSALRDRTRADARLHRRRGDLQVCVATAEKPAGPGERVPVGAAFPMTSGAVAQVLLAWEEPDRLYEGLRRARFTADTLSAVRRRGWAQSVGERDSGIATVTAPVRGRDGRVVAALSVSGPVIRLGRQPGQAYAHPVIEAALRLGDLSGC